MTYEEIVAKAKEEFGSADVSSYEGHLALQINITGEGEGIFYAEISEGKLHIEPYDYKNNDAVLTAGGSDIIDILSGKLDPVKAFETGKLTVTGDLSKALSIQPVIENNKKTAKKSTRKSTSAKASEKAAEKTGKAEKPVKAAKTSSRASAKTAKAADKTAKEMPTIIGLSEPKKTPEKSTAPKSAAKKPAEKAAKESTKSAAKKSAKASKNKKG